MTPTTSTRDVTVDRTPVETSYRGCASFDAPAVVGGVALIETLGILDARYPAGFRRRGDARQRRAASLLAEAFKHAFADRARYLGDTDFVPVDLAHLTCAPVSRRPGQTDQAGRGAAARRLRDARAAAGAAKDAGTTHLSVVDAEGNAVAVTYTLNGGFGNGITVPGLGFLLNNEMDDFALKPGTPNMFGLVAGRGERDRAGQAAAVVDDADHRAEGRQAVPDRRRAGRPAHHHGGRAGDPERHRLDDRAGCDRRAAHPPSVVSGVADRGARDWRARR